MVEQKNLKVTSKNNSTTSKRRISSGTCSSIFGQKSWNTQKVKVTRRAWTVPIDDRKKLRARSSCAHGDLIGQENDHQTSRKRARVWSKELCRRIPIIKCSLRIQKKEWSFDLEQNFNSWTEMKFHQKSIALSELCKFWKQKGKRWQKTAVKIWINHFMFEQPKWLWQSQSRKSIKLNQNGIKNDI